MKGLELPINMIVIIAVAVLILVVVAAFFSGQFGTGVNTIAVNNAFNEGCSSLKSVYNCDPTRLDEVQTSFIPSGRSTPALLLEVCGLKDKNFIGRADLCARACGCNIPTP